MAHWRGEILSGRGSEWDQHLCRSEASYALDWVCIAGEVSGDIEEKMSEAVEEHGNAVGWVDVTAWVGAEPLTEVTVGSVTYRVSACTCPDNV